MRENDTDYEHLHKYLIDIQILLRNNTTMISTFSESCFCFFYLLLLFANIFVNRGWFKCYSNCWGPQFSTHSYCQGDEKEWAWILTG